MAQRKVTITKFENCDANADYPIKMSFKIKEENGVQILEEGSVSSKVALGNNIKVNHYQLYPNKTKTSFRTLLKCSRWKVVSGNI